MTQQRKWREESRVERESLKETHEHGLTAKADKLFELAWEYGHSRGLEEVRAELLMP
jgi:ubiquinone biosynthesis protein Coq4